VVEAEPEESSRVPEAAPEPTVTPEHVPILRPPVLLTPTAAYPGDAHVVTLDRSTLAPEIRTTAAQGRLLLRILVRPDGTVASVQLAEQSGHPALDAAAVQAASGWRFEPASRDGEPIEAWVLVAVRFVVP
jgi:protein TonB